MSHCDHIVKSARQRLAIIKRYFTSGDTKTLVWAFKVFIRPILEYASPVWSPHLLKDINLVESVQRNFTKYLPGLAKKSYSERLKLLRLDSLELRRIKIDLNLTYSLLHGLTGLDYKIFFTIRGNDRTRGHPLKLVVKSVQRDCRKYFFSQRVVNIWNLLPTEVVLAPTITSFKRRLSAIDLAGHTRWT